MSISARDRKILTLLVPIVLIGAFYFFVIKPKRAESAAVGQQLAEMQSRRDAAVSRAGQLESSKTSFAADYATVIGLGKAIPASLDMPSLIVQLDEAAAGTGIDFDSIRAGERTASTTPAPAAAPSGGAPPPASGAPAAGTPASGSPATGAPPAASGPGQAAQAANGAAATSNAASAQSGGTTPPAAGAAAPAGDPTAAPPSGSTAPAGVAGLDSVPLEFSFRGSFFDMTDLFHRLKRFVRVANERVLVRGRLMTVDSFTFTSGESFPQLTAEVKATVYLAPKAEGAVAGATPSGPSPVSPAQPAAQPASSPTPAAATATP